MNSNTKHSGWALICSTSEIMKALPFFLCVAAAVYGEEARRPPSAPFSVSEERARRNRAKAGDQEPVLIKDAPIILPADIKPPPGGGKVEVSLYIKADGSVGNVEVTASTHPMFVAPVIEALKQRRYGPARKDGKPVEYLLSAMVIFPPTREVTDVNAPKR
jgi:hypothetical protein